MEAIAESNLVLFPILHSGWGCVGGRGQVNMVPLVFGKEDNSLKHALGGQKATVCVEHLLGEGKLQLFPSK